MMDLIQFRENAHRLVDWMADYLENIRELDVKSQAEPGQIIGQLPTEPPESGEGFDTIFEDFNKIIVPGMTHWQHPSFHAYFPANSSPPSVLAEMLMSTIGAQCMSWQTSPAATELEERVMQWLGKMIGLPDTFTGVIQDTASTATLCSILTAREVETGYEINRTGLDAQGPFAVYCSSEPHSSIEKAVKIAGLGKERLRKIQVDDKFAMIPAALDAAIKKDLEQGIIPLCVVATVGTTSSTAVDPVRAIGKICKLHDVWYHIDAAYSGTALLLPEARWMSDGIELADTFVFNAHKWMFTNFDCSAYFVKDEEALVRTFEILPEYLKTAEGDRVNNYRDWGIPLGRRFRALKLWFVIRSYGVEGLRSMIRNHIDLAQGLLQDTQNSGEYEILVPVPLNVICFRYKPEGITDQGELDSLNERLMERINSTGRLYLTHTRLNGILSLRLVIGQTQVTKEDVEKAWKTVRSEASGLS